LNLCRNRGLARVIELEDRNERHVVEAPRRHRRCRKEPEIVPVVVPKGGGSFHHG